MQAVLFGASRVAAGGERTHGCVRRESPPLCRMGRIPPPSCTTVGGDEGAVPCGMAKAAAFFDLDRTLLRGASGPLINEALVAAGLAPDRSIPGQGLLYRFYELVGETLPSMALARGAVLATRNWSRQQVQEA